MFQIQVYAIDACGKLMKIKQFQHIGIKCTQTLNQLNLTDAILEETGIAEYLEVDG